MPREKIFERLGLRRSAKEEKVEILDFEKERPKYKRIRHLYPDMDALLTLCDNIAAHLGSEARRAEDVDDLAEAERKIEELYQKITRKK